MKVIGVDVGPSKGGHVCEDGSWPRKMKPEHLDGYLKDIRGDDVLIAWDAPLTGSPDLDAWTDRYDLTTRKIERLFRKRGPYQAPPGISVLPYCSCPHWTISQRLLGLPLVSPYNVEAKLPFGLVTDDRDRPSTGRHVVEVHPAVALWLWCRADGYEGPWQYKKKDKRYIAQLARLMSQRIGHDLTNANDDELDAWTAWYLARCWLDDDGVMLLGDAITGSFLIPKEPDLGKKFEEYRQAR